MAGLLPEMKFMNVQPALQAYSSGMNDYRKEAEFGQQQEQRNLLKQVGQTAARDGLAAASNQALAGGEIGTGIKLQELSLDRQSKLYDFMGRGAAAADTPEKWQAFVGTLARTFGPETVRGFEDFRTRESAIMLAMNAKEQADQKFRQQQLALEERKVKIAEAGGVPKPQIKNMKTETGADRLVRVNQDGTATPITIPGAAEEGNPLAKNIAGGLQNLNKMTETYDDASFTNAVGPIQGADPDGLIRGAPIMATRLFGEVANLVQGGGNSPSEVRSAIKSATETLAAAVKPLIRKPGEGAWTDADQARLVSVVGDLAQSRDKAEFKRRLNNVRDNIASNFNIKIDFDAVGGSKDAAPQTVASKADYDKLPSGAVFVGSDGKQYRKP